MRVGGPASRATRPGSSRSARAQNNDLHRDPVAALVVRPLAAAQPAIDPVQPHEEVRDRAVVGLLQPDLHRAGEGAAGGGDHRPAHALGPAPLVDLQRQVGPPAPPVGRIGDVGRQHLRGDAEPGVVDDVHFWHRARVSQRAAVS